MSALTSTGLEITDDLRNSKEDGNFDMLEKAAVLCPLPLSGHILRQWNWAQRFIIVWEMLRSAECMYRRGNCVAFLHIVGGFLANLDKIAFWIHKLRYPAYRLLSRWCDSGSNARYARKTTFSQLRNNRLNIVHDE